MPIARKDSVAGVSSKEIDHISRTLCSQVFSQVQGPHIKTGLGLGVLGLKDQSGDGLVKQESLWPGPGRSLKLLRS